MLYFLKSVIIKISPDMRCFWTSVQNFFYDCICLVLDGLYSKQEDLCSLKIIWLYLVYKIKQYKKKTTKLKNIEIICVGFAKCLFLPVSWQNFNFGLLLLINNLTVTTNLVF